MQATMEGVHSRAEWLCHLARSASPCQLRLAAAGVANWNLPDLTGKTPLMHAALAGRETIVALLLAAGADVNAVDLLGRTPLHHSIAAVAVADKTVNGCLHSVSPASMRLLLLTPLLLLLAGGDPASVDSVGVTATSAAAAAAPNCSGSTDCAMVKLAMRLHFTGEEGEENEIHPSKQGEVKSLVELAVSMLMEEKRLLTAMSFGNLRNLSTRLETRNSKSNSKLE